MSRSSTSQATPGYFSVFYETWLWIHWDIRLKCTCAGMSPSSYLDTCFPTLLSVPRRTPDPWPPGFFWFSLWEDPEDWRRQQSEIWCLFPWLPPSKVASSNLDHGPSPRQLLWVPGTALPLAHAMRDARVLAWSPAGFVNPPPATLSIIPFLNHLRLILIWACHLFLVGTLTQMVLLPASEYYKKCLEHTGMSFSITLPHSNSCMLHRYPAPKVTCLPG